MKNKKPFGIIYSVRNEITGEFYVGSTTSSLDLRKADHEQKANKRTGYCFHEAISTYGVDAFKWQEVDSAESIDELASKEKEYVIKYNSKDDGYNGDSGGGIKKTVFMYSLEDGRLIDSYDCLESAANTINANKKQVSRACLSVNKSYRGYFWSYEYNEPFEPNEDRRKKKVVYYNFKEDIVLEFNSVAEASRETGVFKSCIAKFCRGERIPPEGYDWEYK